MDNLESIPDDKLKEIVNIYYKEELPNWEELLKDKLLHIFLKETFKIHKTDSLVIATLTGYKNRLKRESYKKY